MCAAAIDRLPIAKSVRSQCSLPVLAAVGGGPVSVPGSAPNNAINPDLGDAARPLAGYGER